MKQGWSSSPLRKLLLNVLDPHGPLGIHSYYPIDNVPSDTSGSPQQHEFDVRQVRREAFYLSCGLFYCRCTSAYEHSRQAPCAATTESSSASSTHTAAQARLRTLRMFILNDFVRETFDYAALDPVRLQETLVPVLQFVRAVLSHCNLNLQQQQQQQQELLSSGAASGSPDQRASRFEFAWEEVYYSLERLLLYCVKTFDASTVLQASIRCD